nr:porin [Roseibaca sp. Y0-43]
MLRRFVFIPLLCAAPAMADQPGLSISGDARMGIVWERPAAAPGSDRAEARLHARARLKLKFSGETDGGLAYGAEIELDKTTARPAARRVFIGG